MTSRVRRRRGCLRSESGDSALLLAGRDTGARLSPDEVVPALITVARRFVDIRGSAWRVGELADPAVLLDGFTRTAEPGGVYRRAARPSAGSSRITHRPGGSRGRGPWSAVGAAGAIRRGDDAPVVITRGDLWWSATSRRAWPTPRCACWRPWFGVRRHVAVAGGQCVRRQPGCERSRADVRAEAVRTRVLGNRGGVVHYVGCEACLRQPAVGTVLVATGEGFQQLPRPTVG